MDGVFGHNMNIVLISKMRPPEKFYTNKNLSFIDSYVRGGLKVKIYPTGLDVLADMNCDSKSAVSIIGIYSDI